MDLVDVNLPVHAVNADSPFHERARQWWDGRLSGSEPVCLAWVTVVGFVRITTSRHVLCAPLTHEEACGYVEGWFGQACVRTIDPLPGHWGLVRSLLDSVGSAGNLTTDAHLAALALQLQPGDEVVVNDLDFPAGVTPWLQPSCRATVRVWRSVDGALRVEDLIPLLSPQTRLVTTSLVSFYNGFVLPLAETIAAVRRHSPALVAVDVTQALGRVPLDLADVDLIVSSSHKWILATHGGGLVGVPQRLADRWTVPAGGWFHLQDAFGADRFERAVSQPGAPSFAVGMPNFPAIYAIRAALEYLRGIGVAQIHAAAQPLVEECRRELQRLRIEMLTPPSRPIPPRSPCRSRRATRATWCSFSPTSSSCASIPTSRERGRKNAIARNWRSRRTKPKKNRSRRMTK